MNDYELDEMRQQMNILKQKLEKQEIVNDKLIRQSMRKNMRSINRKNVMLTMLAVFMVPYSYWAFHVLNDFSLAFWIGTSIFMLICAGAQVYNGHKLYGADLMQSNLMDLQREVARAKKFDTQWLFFGIPLAILWVGWFAYEVYRVNGPDHMLPLLIGGGFGGIVGLIAGLNIYNKMQRQYQEIIDQIEDLTRE